MQAVPPKRVINLDIHLYPNRQDHASKPINQYHINLTGIRRQLKKHHNSCMAMTHACMPKANITVPKYSWQGYLQGEGLPGLKAMNIINYPSTTIPQNN